MSKTAIPSGGGATGASRPKTQSSAFSNPSPLIDEPNDTGGVFSGITSGVKEAANAVGEAIPIFTKSELRDQRHDQLRDPTFDRRFARDRVGDVETTTQSTERQPGGQGTLIPGVSNRALLFFGVAGVGLMLIARSF